MLMSLKHSQISGKGRREDLVKLLSGSAPTRQSKILRWSHVGMAFGIYHTLTAVIHLIMLSSRYGLRTKTM